MWFLMEEQTAIYHDANFYLVIHHDANFQYESDHANTDTSRRWPHNTQKYSICDLIF